MKNSHPTPRGQRQAIKRGLNLNIGLLMLLLIEAIVIIATIASFTVKPKAEGSYITHDSLGPVYTHDGKDIIRIYVFKDPDTNNEYLVSDHGGIVLRSPRVRTYSNSNGTSTEVNTLD